LKGAAPTIPNAVPGKHGGHLCRVSRLTNLAHVRFGLQTGITETAAVAAACDPEQTWRRCAIPKQPCQWPEAVRGLRVDRRCSCSCEVTNGEG
jgi:hypothetical protein